MSGVLALARREFASTFLVPTGWIILAGWGMLTALIFAFVTPREKASRRRFGRWCRSRAGRSRW